MPDRVTWDTYDTFSIAAFAVSTRTSKAFTFACDAEVLSSRSERTTRCFEIALEPFAAGPVSDTGEGSNEGAPPDCKDGGGDRRGTFTGLDFERFVGGVSF